MRKHPSWYIVAPVHAILKKAGLLRLGFCRVSMEWHDASRTPSTQAVCGNQDMVQVRSSCCKHAVRETIHQPRQEWILQRHRTDGKDGQAVPDPTLNLTQPPQLHFPWLLHYYLLKNPKRIKDKNNPYITLIRKNICVCCGGVLKQ